MLRVCPVCRTTGPRALMRIGKQAYWACGTCEARFLDPSQHPGAAAERAHYSLHENDPDDPRYRAFLAKLATPLLAKLMPARACLDYGCGPGPALARMLNEAGHETVLYDPFFYPDQGCLAGNCIYDVITCTEVAEHFHHPADEFDRLDGLLAPGGWLAVMTCFQIDDSRFANWHYRMDPTHVVFYREATLRWIATWHGWSCEIPCKDVALMQKPISTTS